MKLLLSLLLIWLTATNALAFDHQHQNFNDLLQKHVSWNADGSASRVDYDGFKRDQQQLEGYLKALSAVDKSEFDRWRKPQRLAFLINAYNAFTIELILSEYPDLQSIKDLGSLFSSPWSKTFFSLFGEKHSLDDIEQNMIRVPGAYDDPRIHAAVVCASIGCPGLRNEALVAERLDEQLEDSLRRFLSDHSRNRFNAAQDTLEVSRIFDWYGDDFAKGFRQHRAVKSFLADYADQLSAQDAERKRIRNGDFQLDYLDYDWSLNKGRF